MRDSEMIESCFSLRCSSISLSLDELQKYDSIISEIDSITCTCEYLESYDFTVEFSHFIEILDWECDYSHAERLLSWRWRDSVGVFDCWYWSIRCLWNWFAACSESESCNYEYDEISMHSF